MNKYNTHATKTLKCVSELEKLLPVKIKALQDRSSQKELDVLSKEINDKFLELESINKSLPQTEEEFAKCISELDDEGRKITLQITHVEEELLVYIEHIELLARRRSKGE